MACQFETKMKYLDWIKSHYDRLWSAIFFGSMLYGLVNLAFAAMFFVFEKLIKNGAWLMFGLDIAILCAFIYWMYNHTINIDIEPKEKN